MVQIENAIVSFDLFDSYFLCDLMACKGACCVEGDSGAPLTRFEANQIEKYYPLFSACLDERYKRVIERKGFAVTDNDGDLVTPLFNNRECVYTFVDENGFTKCAIEKAYLEGKTDFRKPISCHLYPVRITLHQTFEAVNYQQIDICQPGKQCGNANQLPLFKFLKEPLIRKYGEKWYEELELVAEQLKNYKR
jgi:hypothetical protein